MPFTKLPRSISAIAILAAPVLLAGCGGSSPKVAVKDFKGIYTTASDCADSGKLSYEDCSAAMAQAVQKHETDAPSYGELRFCEAKEGDGKCEGGGEQKYRPKLFAFLVTAGKTTTAVPLYAHTKGEEGFRDLAGATYMHANPDLVFSSHAQTMYEKIGKKSKKR